MALTIGSLTREPSLLIRLLTPTGHDSSTLQTPVTWVHSSDLADPTPFLTDSNVLLTTGAQFADAKPTRQQTDAYVARLTARGIAALGFGRGVLHAETPEALIASADAAQLPLFEVAYETPFLAIVRFAADVAAQDAYARSLWALRAQRAISLAAIRPDGLSAILAELSRQLDHWVAVIHNDAYSDRVFPPGAMPTAVHDQVRTQALRMLRRGRRASKTIHVAGDDLSLQTLGGRGRLRGVLAVGAPSHSDRARADVVTSVVALAGLALEQHHALDAAQAHLRTGLLRLLMTGEHPLVDTISRQMWERLPDTPLRIAVAAITADQVDTVTEWCAGRTVDGGFFYAFDGMQLVLCLRADAASVAHELAAAFEVSIGVSLPHGYDDFARGFREALEALGDGLGARATVTDYGDVAARGMLSLLDGERASDAAHAMLTPLLDDDSQRDGALLHSLRVWLENGARFDPAARQLGVHRHTLRARIARAESLLGWPLTSFRAQADLWAALNVLA